ncbi:MAG TPA: DNA double-strand break repair nuclease NurA [Anaerolineales bacterium]|nr:DNA double-strand break repair nuclease NurA [Anaerolineales bacterium]
MDELRAKVDSAKAVDANVRCAYPLDENLASTHPPPVSVKEATLIAADGSQIVPDRHAALQYYVVNVGAIVMQVGSGSTPEVFTDTKLHMLDEFEDTFFSDSQIALQRDLAERKKLLEVAQKYKGTIIALTEGQLELWGAMDNDNSRDFEKSLQDYMDALKEMERQKVITSGYVDKPGANWVVRLLEIAMIPQDELSSLKKYHPFLGVTDLWLFGRILGRHERSAIFKLQAKSAEKYTGPISIHFFYINVGDEKKPKIARVDIPLWVANNREALNNLHSNLIEQAKIMGNEPFPYLLHRAHEIAVITHKEKEEIDQMLAIEIRNNGGELGEKSGKQSAKDLQGRTRR